MNFFTPNKNKYFSSSLIFLILASFLFFGNFQKANAQADPATAATAKAAAESASKLVTQMTSAVDSCTWTDPVDCSLLHILKFEGYMLSASATLFGYITDPDKLTSIIDNEIIYTTWKFVRDMLNFVFIMVLLFSAFSTIFQVEKYSYKKILLTLVLMALLVNFSFPVVRFIIDVSNVLMYTLLNNLFPEIKEGGEIFTQLLDKSSLSSIIKPAGIEAKEIDLSYLIMAIIFVFVFMVNLLTIAVLLLIRAIALAILIIFSPIAFVGAILPKGTGKEVTNYSNQYWDSLFKYALFGPIMIFMLSVATKMMQSMEKIKEGMKPYATYQTGVDQQDFITSVAFFCIPTVIIWIGIGIAQSMGIAGGSAITGKAKGLMGWAGKTFSGYRLGAWGVKKAEEGAKYGVEALAKTADRKILGNWSAQHFAEGWRRQRDVKEREHKENAGGHWQDRINKFFGEKTNFKDAGFESNVSTKKKEMADVSQESAYLLNEFKAAESSKDTAKMCAVLKLMFANNDQNEFMKGLNESVEPEHMKHFIHDNLRASGLSEEQTLKQMTDLSEIAFEKGNYSNFGMTTYDEHDNKFRLTKTVGEKRMEKKRDGDGNVILKNNNPIWEEKEIKIDEQSQNAVGKAGNIEPQTKMRSYHWNTLATETPEGNVGKIHDKGKEMLLNVTGSEIDQVNRGRVDFINKIGTKEKRDEIKAFADIVERGNAKEIAEAKAKGKDVTKIRKIAPDKNQAKLIRKFADEIYSFKKNGKQASNVKKEDIQEPTYNSEEAKDQANKAWEEATKK